MKKNLLLFALLCATFVAQAQNPSDEDALFIRRIYDKALTDSRAYAWLEHLCTQIGGRLSGSDNAAKAVEYTRQMLDTLGVAKVSLQPCMVPHWERGNPETVVALLDGKIQRPLRALALGGSVAGDVTANIVMVKSLAEAESLGDKAKGKIIFFNRPMDKTQINVSAAYGGAVDQRVAGASAAAKVGAVGVLVRSMTTELDDNPHTGTMQYKDGIAKIPAAAISTNDAEWLQRQLTDAPKTTVRMKLNGQWLPDAPSNNVIAEWRGTEFPDEIITIGGHLDSWDVAQGAHDDGAGVVHAMDVLHLLKQTGYRPRRTIRIVLFMNEENGGAGGKKYAAESNEKKEKHLAAIESDGGGFSPRGFTCEAMPEVFVEKFKKFSAWSAVLEPYGITLSKGGSGADISPLKSQGGLLIGLRPDTQRYFDIHHTANDVFANIHKRELELGAAACTALVYLLDKYGL